MRSSQTTTFLKFTALNSDRVLGAYRLPADWQRRDTLALRMSKVRIALELLHNTQVQLRTATEEEWRTHVDIVTQ